MYKYLKKRFKSLLPDWLYLKLAFRKNVGYPLNLKNPKSFNEKIQWLKLYGRLEQYAHLVDKYEALYQLS